MGALACGLGIINIVIPNIYIVHTMCQAVSISTGGVFLLTKGNINKTIKVNPKD